MENGQKQKRASKPKVRTGCLTCKLRHVKCDEGRPACRRCEKFGVKCDGYQGDKPKPETKRIHILPKSEQGAGYPVPDTTARYLQATQLLPISVYQQPSANPLFQVEKEFYYFKLFQDRTADELSGYFDTDIWNLVVLRTSHHEAFARHAVIALGALHQTMECVKGNDEPFLSSLSRKRLGDSHHRFALQHYSKALEAMKPLAQMKGGVWRRNILLSCLLVACFENYIGDHESALAAARRGIDVLIAIDDNPGEWKKSIETPHKAVTRRSVEDNDIFATFARLQATIIKYHNDRLIPRGINPLSLERLTPFLGLEIPDQFESVRQARFFCDFFVLRAMTWREVYLMNGAFSSLDFGEEDPIAKQAKIEQFTQRIKTEFRLCVGAKAKWMKAFRPLFDETREKPGSKDFFGASILMIQYISSNLMTHLPSQILETHYDQFQDQMVEMIDLSKELLEKYPRTRSKRVVFMFDDGVVAGLFLVAIRCRDRVIRRQALELLLKHPRREGLCDSIISAKIAKWLMELEEEGTVDGFVPENARLRIVKMDVKLLERTAVVRCSKLEDGSQERVDLEDVTMTW